MLKKVRFFSKVMAFVEECAIPQAIVTVNPARFTNVVVLEYQFDRLVDLSVTSWQQGTEDKSALCQCAIAKLGITPFLRQCLLVDDRADHVIAWRSKGGTAYHYRGEDAFCEEFAAVVND